MVFVVFIKKGVYTIYFAHIYIHMFCVRSRDTLAPAVIRLEFTTLDYILNAMNTHGT